MDGTDDNFALGAVICDPANGCDTLLEMTARRLHAEGHRVAAYVHRHMPQRDECCDAIEVEEVFSGRRWLITQSLGSGSQACRLDPHGLAQVAADALEMLDQKPAIVILNRFGKSEAEGQGVRAVLERGCAEGVPLLIAVKPDYLAAWNAFSGGLARVIPAEAEAVLDWCRQAVAECHVGEEERAGRRAPER